MKSIVKDVFSSLFFVAGIIGATSCVLGALFWIAESTPEHQAWVDAKKLAHVTNTWQHPTLTHCPYQMNSNVLGVWGLTMRTDDYGRIVVDETINIYVPDTDPCYKQVITHEYLHAIWYRLAMADRAFEAVNPSSEGWVQSVLPSTCRSLVLNVDAGN